MLTECAPALGCCKESIYHKVHFFPTKAYKVPALESLLDPFDLAIFYSVCQYVMNFSIRKGNDV